MNQLPDQELYLLETFGHESTKKQLFISKFQLTMFNLSFGQKLTLQIGFTVLEVIVTEQPADSPKNRLYLSKRAYQELIYYQGEPLWLAFLSAHQIVLGPTVGITVSLNTWKNIDQIYAIEQRAQLALKKGILFFCFHLSKVDLKNNLVAAYFLNPATKKWIKKLLPFPQVLYHRSTFTIDNHVHQKLWQNHNIQKINAPAAFDKWTVYQALALCEETSRLQPETMLFSQSTLKQFLKKYQYCYVKNIYGRGGKQVVKVGRKRKHFICQAGGSQLKKWQFTNLQSLYSFLRGRLGQELIIQQGISLARLEGRPFDIRVLVQKNFNAEWVITVLSFRLADSDAAVTNIAAGAKEIAVAPGENLLGSGLSMALLENITLKTLSSLEASYGNLGEVGLDIGLDDHGRLWVIEANSQPSSRGYREAAAAEVCEQIFGLPLDYAKYLVRQQFSRSET